MSEKNSKPVIFLAFANEQGGEGHQGYLRKLPEELRHLQAILERAAEKGLCELVVRTNATLEQILEVFQSAERRDRIAIFHYGGHASNSGLYLESSGGQAHEASAEGLAEFLGQQDGLELVFLNGCSTQGQARGLLDANVSAVIATSQAIDDDVATAFAGHFYNGLAGGAGLRVAFKEAESAVVSHRGADTTKLYRHIGGSAAPEFVTDEFPWRMHVRPGAETTERWNLPDAADNPLLGLPELPEYDLPDRPYRQLNFYTESDAEVFFGRGYQIRELYHLVTDTSAAPIVLYCGQSGVGKSSLLNAGLIPRLRHRDVSPHQLRDFRRRRSLGLTAMMAQGLGAADGAAFGEAWLAMESELGNPVTVIADQVEEVFTRPNPDLPGELEDFLDALVPVYARTSSRPQGKLILSFRKEWVQDIKRRLEERKLPHTVRYLESLDRRGIVEAIEGPASTERLRDKYQLTIEQGLAETMAVQLLEDSESTVAPTLQIRLGRMWESAGSPPVFDRELYESLENEGFGLDRYLDLEFDLLRKAHARVIDSGLALDVLAFHTTARGTAEARTDAEIEQRYPHVQDEVKAFVSGCKERYLLISITTTRPGDEERNSTPQTRLAHDTLAPLIRERLDHSNRPGQRARRILESRAIDWQAEPYGAPLDEADLAVVENGNGGMRARSDAEQRLVEASVRDRAQRQEARRQRERTRRRTRRIIQGLGALLVVLGVIAGFGGYRASERADQVYAAGITSLADAQEDPLLASLLISSLKGHDTPANAVQVALKVAHSTVPLDIMAEHGDDVNSIACSPNGQFVVSASTDASARVWNIGEDSRAVELRHHDRRLNGAIFNTNSRQVATWADDGKVYLQMAHGEERPRLVADHEKAVETVQFDPMDDTVLMTASDDGSVNLWDVSGSRHDGPAGGHCLALSVEAGGEDGDTGQAGRPEPICKIRVLADTGDPIRSASYSPDGRYIAAVTESGGVRLWSARASDDYHEFEVPNFHAEQIMHAAFSPIAGDAANPAAGSSRYLVTASRDNSAALWRLDVLENAPGLTDPVVLAGHSDWVNSAHFSPDGQRILTISDDGSAVYWDRENLSNYARLCGHAARVTSGEFSGDARFIVTASADDTARVWDVLALEEQLRSQASAGTLGGEGAAQGDCRAPSPVTPLMVLKGHTDDLTGAVFCGNDKRVVTASHDDTLRLWDLTRLAEPRVLARQGSAALDVEYNWNGELIAAAFEANPALVVDGDGGVRKRLGYAGSVDFIPAERAQQDGDYVLTISRETPTSRNWSLVHEWPVAGGSPATLASGGPFQSAVYGPHGDRFITSSVRGPTRMWKVNREPLDCCESHGKGSFYAEFSHDGASVITAMLGGTAVWGRAPGGPPLPGGTEQTVSLGNHASFVTMAVFSPDDRFVATSSSDETVSITPVDRPGESRVFTDHNGTVNSVAFSHDGRLLVSGSDDGKAIIRDIEGSGEPIVLTADGSAIRHAEFSPDGRRVITASNDGGIRIWRFGWEDLLQYLDDSTRICLTAEQRMDYLNENRDAASANYDECQRREREGS
jgi:WD40 repeat protein